MNFSLALIPLLMFTAGFLIAPIGAVIDKLDTLNKSEANRAGVTLPIGVLTILCIMAPAGFYVLYITLQTVFGNCSFIEVLPAMTFVIGMLFGWIFSLRIAGIQIVVQPTIFVSSDPQKVTNEPT